MYKYKYHKYKQKYLAAKKGGSIDRILFIGTSSTGKTTLAKLLEADGYHHINYDYYYKPCYNEIYGSLSNDYISKDDIKKLADIKISKIMLEESKKYDKVVIDHAPPEFHDLDPDVYTILLYAPFEILIDHMEKRKKIEPRTSMTFIQYTRLYTKTNSKEKAIDIINRKEFIEQLKRIKYEFSSEKNLINFATKIFANMDIHDNYDHMIVPRETTKYNRLIHIRDKTPKEIYNMIIQK